MKIIVDTREQQPWRFDIWDCKTKSAKLDYGDYSIEGLERYVSIERKKSTGELALNLGKQRERFFRELEELSKFPHAYLICEFPAEHFETFPVNSTIPKFQWKTLKMNKGAIAFHWKKVQAMNINIIHCDNAMDANMKAYEILNNVYQSIKSKS